jgi:hypothetical protein
MLLNMHAEIDFTHPHFQVPGLFAAMNYEDITIRDRKTLRPIDTISLSSLSSSRFQTSLVSDCRSHWVAVSYLPLRVQTTI